MAIVEFKPGDKLCINLGVRKEGEPGVYTVASLVDYETIIDLMSPKQPVENKRRRSHKSKNNGTKISRAIGLFSRAMISGTWCTGAPIERGTMAEAFIEKMRRVSYHDYLTITPKAKKSLDSAITFLYKTDDMSADIGQNNMDQLETIRKNMGYE